MQQEQRTNHEWRLWRVARRANQCPMTYFPAPAPHFMPPKGPNNSLMRRWRSALKNRAGYCNLSGDVNKVFCANEETRVHHGSISRYWHAPREPLPARAPSSRGLIGRCWARLDGTGKLHMCVSCGKSGELKLKRLLLFLMWGHSKLIVQRWRRTERIGMSHTYAFPILFRNRTV